MKYLLFTMLDLSNLSQAIAQVWFDNMFFEYWQENHWETSPTQRSFSLGVRPHLMATSLKDNPMQIDETWFNIFMKQEK